MMLSRKLLVPLILVVAFWVLAFSLWLSTGALVYCGAASGPRWARGAFMAWRGNAVYYGLAVLLAVILRENRVFCKYA